MEDSNDVTEEMMRGPVNPAALEALREADWRELHWRLRSLAQQRVALEAEEVGWLLEAEETHLYRRLGYSTMTEYMERELHWGPHAANERLRVARELRTLPLIAEQFKTGEMCFSAVRELTRVATPGTEEAFLKKAHGRTARDVERMVAGLKRGDDPEAEPNPKLIKKRIVLEVTVPVYARFRRTRTALENERGARLDDSELLEMLLRRAEEPDMETTGEKVPRPAVQVAVTTCKKCRRDFVAVGGEQLPIDPVTAEQLKCDSVFIGDLETNELTRPKPHIPDAIRRKVFQRDGFACVVPGCRATRNIDVHHLRFRCHGGQHVLEWCCALCGGHHAQLHHGKLVIHGPAPDLRFEWRPDDDVEIAATAPPLEFEDVPRPHAIAPRTESTS